MLKQLLSVSDVKQLKTGDQLSDHPECIPQVTRIYRGVVTFRYKTS